MRVRMAASRRNVVRALKTAVVVGPILTMINQTPALTRLVEGEGIPPIAVLRIVLTFVVPFVVSLWSSVMADRARQTLE